MPHRLHLRMTAHERLQHAALALSFIMLVLTGFMLRFPEAWWVVAIRSVSSRAFVARALLHRLAGMVLIAAGLWHAGYLAFTPQGRRLFLDLLPRWRDRDGSVEGAALQSRLHAGKAEVRPLQLRREGRILGAHLGHGAHGRHRRDPLVREHLDGAASPSSASISPGRSIFTRPSSRPWRSSSGTSTSSSSIPTSIR